MKNDNHQQQDNHHPIGSLFLKIILLILGLVLLITLIGFFQPYQQIAEILNKLAPDGEMERFTPLFYQTLKLPVLLIGSFLLILNLVALIKFNKTKKIVFQNLSQFFGFLKSFVRDWKIGVGELTRAFDKRTLLILGALVVFAFLMRIILLGQPMEHDESYSSVVFAFEPLVNGLSDYHFPNNHVFHTFLVHLVYAVLGPQEWVVRLPAMIAGILLAPLGYILARRWYGERTAWLAGIMIAVLPDLIAFSLRARGYSLMAFFTLLIFIVGDVVKRKNNRAAWFLLGIFGALGFYTLPIMAYPLFILYAWLGLSWLVGDFGKDYTRRTFLLSTLFSGLIAVSVGLFLYVPIFLNWGMAGLFANSYVEAIPKDLYSQTLLVRLYEAWQVLNWGAVPGIGWLLISGMLMTIVLFRRFNRDIIPLPITSLLVLTLLIMIQRPNVFARTWHFYFPLLCIWSAAGWTHIFNPQTYIQLPVMGKKQVSYVLSLLIAFLFFINGVTYVVEKHSLYISGQDDIEEATLYLKDQLQPEDIVVITAIDDAPMWFYFEKHGLGRDYFSRSKPFERAFVVVTTSDPEQSIDYVVADRGPDFVFFDWDTTQKVSTIGNLDIYLIQADSAVINREYGLP